jgi:hypothetical protein
MTLGAMSMVLPNDGALPYRAPPRDARRSAHGVRGGTRAGTEGSPRLPDENAMLRAATLGLEKLLLDLLGSRR